MGNQTSGVKTLSFLFGATGSENLFLPFIVVFSCVNVFLLISIALSDSHKIPLIGIFIMLGHNVRIQVFENF